MMLLRHAIVFSLLLGASSLPVRTKFEATLRTLPWSSDSCSLPSSDKVDCGFVGVDQPTCEQKGCCWVPAEPNSDTPWCFFKKGDAPTCSLKAQPSLPFSPTEIDQVRQHFKANIDIAGKGGVVAAPDHNTGPGGDYYWAWERDGALSMNAYLQTFADVEDIHPIMQHYVGWVKRVQSETDPNSQSVLDEPKYILPDGKVFDQPWCRPQNDGPALRARTLMAYAASADASYVQENLWTADGKGPIQIDLDFVTTVWDQQTCDLWEEIRSSDFFWNRMSQRAALHEGVAMAKKFGDAERTSKYASVAAQIDSQIKNHYNGNFVFEDQSRQKDSAVIEAFNKQYLNDGVFAPLSVEVGKTVLTLNQLFCSSFSINQADSKAGVPGILYGRYQGDSYDGGNPWVLLSASLAQLLYRAATDAAAKGAKLDDDAWAAWNEIAGEASANRDTAALGKALLGAGDGVMTRIHKHVTPEMHMNEQIDRNTGGLTSAKDLTWNYANILTAMKSRTAAASALGL